MRLPFRIILLVLLIACRKVETGVGAEFLEFDLGFEAVLGFRYPVHQFVPVGIAKAPLSSGAFGFIMPAWLP